jgi:hypothetical protein
MKTLMVYRMKMRKRRRKMCPQFRPLSSLLSTRVPSEPLGNHMPTMSKY